MPKTYIPFAANPFVSSVDETPIRSARLHGLSSSLEANGTGEGVCDAR